MGTKASRLNGSPKQERRSSSASQNRVSSQQQMQLRLFNETHPIKDALNIMMSNREVRLTPEDLSHVMTTSSIGYRAVTQPNAKHRVAEILAASEIQSSFYSTRNDFGHDLPGYEFTLTAEGELYQKNCEQEPKNTWVKVKFPNNETPKALFGTRFDLFILTTNNHLYLFTVFRNPDLPDYRWKQLKVEVGGNDSSRERALTQGLGFWSASRFNLTQTSSGKFFISGGDNNLGELGIGSGTTKPFHWHEIDLPNHININELDSGSSFNCIRTKDGDIYTAGSLPGAKSNEWQKQDLPGNMRASKVLAGTLCLLFINEVGELYGRGVQMSGEFGLPGDTQLDDWQQITLPENAFIRDAVIAADHDSSVVKAQIFITTHANQVFCRGYSPMRNLSTDCGLPYRDQWHELPLPEEVAPVAKMFKANTIIFFVTEESELLVYQASETFEGLVKLDTPAAEKIVRVFHTDFRNTFAVTKSGLLYRIDLETYTFEPVDLPEGVSLLQPPPDLPKSFAAVSTYLDSQDDADALDVLVDALSEGQLVTALLKMPTEKADKANRDAHTAIYGKKKGTKLIW